jgi:glycosyltransferase involved in cell wall biosynthesis
MMQIPERTLIYDRDISGHHLDYLQFLVEYLKSSPVSVREQFIFVLHEGAKARFQNDESLIQFRFIPLQQLEEFLSHTSVLRRAGAEMNYLTKLIHEYEAKRLIFMHIDAFQYEVGRSAVRRLGVKLSGLLFLPFRKYYEDGSTLKAKLRREWRGWRKGWQIRWMLRNPLLERIFFLNDKQGVKEYNQCFGNRFEHLPDPIEVGQITATSVEELKTKYGVEENKRVFLIYGHLSSRKNVPNILAALKRIDIKQRQRICVLICGEPEKGYESTLYTSINEAEKKYPEVRFVKHFRFFNPADTNEVFKISDVVLVPYINFFSSSNILGLAAKYSKPLIASNLGVMEGLVNQYKLGITVSPQRPEAIAEAMNMYLNQILVTIDGKKYLEDHSAEVFCQKLLF